MATQEVSRYLQKLSLSLFSDEALRERFITALHQPTPYPETILWVAEKPSDTPFHLVERIEWQPAFVDRLVPGQRPGAHELHQAGAYYCLDFSSVFAASVLQEISIQSPVVLDLCAAPGGKSVFAYRALAPELLICNETIGKRLGALTSNLRRCNIEPVVVTNRDPRVLAEAFEGGADIVIVDAPCSGQSLLTKGQESAGCFHPATVNMNKNRQRRIIAEASRLVASGGYLAYMTCTFSSEENEEIVEWFLKKFPAFEALTVSSLTSFQSHLSDEPCYRLWPHMELGAGAFAALFRLRDEGPRTVRSIDDLPVSWSRPEGLFRRADDNHRKKR